MGLSPRRLGVTFHPAQWFPEVISVCRQGRRPQSAQGQDRWRQTLITSGNHFAGWQVTPSRRGDKEQSWSALISLSIIDPRIPLNLVLQLVYHRILLKKRHYRWRRERKCDKLPSSLSRHRNI